jgi:DNA-binding response OmpR family regulator
MDNEKSLYNILFIEDEVTIRENYVRFLQRYFQNVYEANDGEEALSIYNKEKIDIMIIDINLPKLNGIDFLKIVRKNDHTVKAIMLTANSDVDTLLSAIDLKLSQYLVKPITRDELKTALNKAIGEISKFNIHNKHLLTLNNSLTWNYDNNELVLDGVTVALTHKETKVLSILCSNPNKTFTYDDIIFDVWYEDEDNKTDALKTIIKNLRKKLPENTIKNVFGIGYKVEV